MGKFPRPSGTAATPPKIDHTEDWKEIIKDMKKESEPTLNIDASLESARQKRTRQHKEHDLLVKCLMVLERYDGYKAFKGRVHWVQARELIEEIKNTLN